MSKVRQRGDKGMSFAAKVYVLCKKIPKGKISTYGEIARALSTSPRAVGQALKKNPYKSVPCHRVVCSDGRIGGFRGKSRGKDIAEKCARLKAEGVVVKNGLIENFEKLKFLF